MENTAQRPRPSTAETEQRVRRIRRIRPSGNVWFPQQLELLDAVAEWQANARTPFFYLDGVAGSGKTTLAREIARRTEGKTLFAALMGKAAAVMRRKGCEGATAIELAHLSSEDRAHMHGGSAL